MDTIAEEKRLPVDIDAQPVVQAAAALSRCSANTGRRSSASSACRSAGRADARGRLLSHGDPARARRAAGRSADLSARRRAAGRGLRLGRLEPRQQQHRPAGHARACRRRACRRFTATGPTDPRRHRGAGRRHRRCRSRAAIASAGAGASAAAARRPPGCSAASRSSTTASRAAAPTAAACTGAASSRAPRPRSCPGSWDVTGLRGTGSFDWTVEGCVPARAADDGPCRRAARQPVGRAGRGSTYALPAQAWVGPHHSAVITGIARAGIDALIELAGGKTAARPPAGPAVRQPAGAGCGRPRRRDPQRRARLPQRDDHRTVEHDRRRRARRRSSSVRAAGWPRPTPPTAPARRWIWCTGSAAAPRSSAKAASPNAGATCIGRADRDDGAGMVPDRRPRLSRHGPRLAYALIRAVLGGLRPTRLVR